MLALKARCMEDGDSMMGAEEVGGLKDGRLPVRAAFPLGAFPSKALNACTAQPHSSASPGTNWLPTIRGRSLHVTAHLDTVLGLDV